MKLPSRLWISVIVIAGALLVTESSGIELMRDRPVLSVFITAKQCQSSYDAVASWLKDSVAGRADIHIVIVAERRIEAEELMRYMAMYGKCTYMDMKRARAMHVGASVWLILRNKNTVVCEGSFFASEIPTRIRQLLKRT